MTVQETAKSKLEKLVTEGPATVRDVLAKVMEDQPDDYLVAPNQFEFLVDDKRLQMEALTDSGSKVKFNIHPHAIGQISDKAGIPSTFVGRLMESGEWGMSLLVHNLNQLRTNVMHDKYMVRSVRNSIRGFLSGKYLRLDPGMLLESFINAAQGVGAVPTNAVFTDTKFNIRMSIPKVYEPVDGEPVVFGMTLKESSFGDGALVLGASVMRLVCLNGMIGEDVLRRVHLGSLVTGDFAISNKTYRLDSEAKASMIRDAVSQSLEPKAIEAKMGKIKQAATDKISLKGVLEKMRKDSKLSKGEVDKTADIFNTGGIEQLPVGNTMWRLANAISFLSQDPDMDRGRSMELEQLAGQLVAI